MIGSPSGELSLKRAECTEVMTTQLMDLILGRLSFQPNLDGPVIVRRRQLPNQRDNFGAPRRVAPRLEIVFLRSRANDEREFTFVATVDHSSDVVVLRVGQKQGRVVDQDRGMPLLDRAKQRGARDVPAVQLTKAQPANQLGQRGFATAMGGTLNPEDRGDVEGFDGVREEEVQRHRVDGGQREPDMIPNNLDDLIGQGGPIDRVWPRVRLLNDSL